MRRVLLGVLLLGPIASACNAAEPQLCAGWPSVVEPKELRVTEADLTKAKAEKAANFMRDYVAANGRKGEWYESLNALLVLEGYIRKQQALELPSKEATEEFCTWLTTVASWND